MSKTILITGASSGIGAATARYAVDAGNKVALLARSTDKLTAPVNELGEENALALPCDVTDYDAQSQAFQSTFDRFGSIDVVFANAGLGAEVSGTEKGDPENFKEMILVNNLAVTYTCKLAISELKKSKGQLLITGSRAGNVAIPGSVYGATKWFIKGYAANLAAELAGSGVRVTNIEPGMVDTAFFSEAKPQALRDEDIARAVLYIIDQPNTVNVATMQVFPTPQG